MKNSLKALIIFFLLSCCMAQGQSKNWKIIGKMPFSISGSEAVAVDSTIFFFGGYSDTLQRVVDWVYTYTPGTNTWKMVGHMRRNRVNFIADKIGNKVYCVGGEENTPPRAKGVLEEFDCSTFNSSIIDSNQAFNRKELSGLIKDSILYIVGGMSYVQPGGMNPYIIEYNIPQRRVVLSYIPMFSGVRAEQMTALLFNNIFIFGGLYNTVSSDIDSYDIFNHQLERQHTSLLRPRANGKAVKTDSNEVVIIGGYNEVNLALNSTEIWTFVDSMHQTINTFQPMNFRRNNFMAVYYAGSIFVFGGVDEFGKPVEIIERFNFITDIRNENDQIPSEYKIEQNYPNPFNSTTIIKYKVSTFSRISIKVYDITGRKVADLINEEKLPGNYKISFNDNGLASGVYYYRIIASPEGMAKGNSFTETKKMILIK